MKIKGIHLIFIIVMRKFVLITEMLYISSIISKIIYIYISYVYLTLVIRINKTIIYIEFISFLIAIYLYLHYSNKN